MKHLISMRDISDEDILSLIDLAQKIENKEINPDMSGKLAALLFFEPSTRTHFSFDTAVKKLQGSSFSMSGTGNTSVRKGESLSDTLTTISMYADLIIMRHTIEGAARYASEMVNIPVINAGDGTNQHPTQAMLDLYSIKKTQGTLQNLTIGMVGDLRLGRTVHSLAHALSSFNPRFYFASPRHLQMPASIKADLRSKQIEFHELEEIMPVMQELDIMYVTRIQRERFIVPEDYEKVKDSYIISKKFLQNVKENFRLLHPLPRVNEIAKEVDDTPYAYYFQQARNGVYMRQAIITKLLNLPL
ncbi:MAG: aspartate carbamoyltransferase [Bacteroidia bacterium]|nr:MAG: aspartate carbamoyltransferase [Bacteroidia bacterium]